MQLCEMYNEVQVGGEAGGAPARVFDQVSLTTQAVDGDKLFLLGSVHMHRATAADAWSAGFRVRETQGP